MVRRTIVVKYRVRPPHDTARNLAPKLHHKRAPLNLDAVSARKRLDEPVEREIHTHTHTEVGPAGGFCIPRRCPVPSAGGGGGGGDAARGCSSSSSSSTAPESRLVSAGGRWPCRMWPTYLPITSRKRAETALLYPPARALIHAT